MNTTTSIIITATPHLYFNNKKTLLLQVFFFMTLKKQTQRWMLFQIILKVQDQIPTVLAGDPEAGASPCLLPAA